MGAAASISMAPFTVEFDVHDSFSSRFRLGPRVLTGEKGVARLHELHGLLVTALREAGFGGSAVGETARYKPHVTLAYGLPWIAASDAEPVSWNVREFVLMHSLLGRSTHVALARWPLIAAS